MKMFNFELGEYMNIKYFNFSIFFLIILSFSLFLIGSETNSNSPIYASKEEKNNSNNSNEKSDSSIDNKNVTQNNIPCSNNNPAVEPAKKSNPINEINLPTNQASSEEEESDLSTNSVSTAESSGSFDKKLSTEVSNSIDFIKILVYVYNNKNSTWQRSDLPFNAPVSVEFEIPINELFHFSKTGDLYILNKDYNFDVYVQKNGKFSLESILIINNIYKKNLKLREKLFETLTSSKNSEECPESNNLRATITNISDKKSNPFFLNESGQWEKLDNFCQDLEENIFELDKNGQENIDCGFSKKDSWDNILNFNIKHHKDTFAILTINDKIHATTKCTKISEALSLITTSCALKFNEENLLKLLELYKKS